MATHKKAKTSSSSAKRSPASSAASRSTRSNARTGSSHFDDISPRQRGKFTEHGSSFDRNEENFSASSNDLGRNGSANRYEADRFEQDLDSRSSRTRRDYNDQDVVSARQEHGRGVGSRRGWDEEESPRYSSRSRGMNEEDYEDHEDDGPRFAHGLEVEDDEQEDGFESDNAPRWQGRPEGRRAIADRDQDSGYGRSAGRSYGNDTATQGRRSGRNSSTESRSFSQQGRSSAPSRNHR